jgi:hypothetical protein
VRDRLLLTRFTQCVSWGENDAHETATILALVQILQKFVAENPLRYRL